MDKTNLKSTFGKKKRSSKRRRKKERGILGNGIQAILGVALLSETSKLI